MLRGRWMECVPNFSEGRDEEAVRRIARAAESTGALLLDIHLDADHNRSVITLAGEPDALVEGVFRAVERAVSILDISAHVGVHPRIGVADVVPFVPISGVTREECVRAAGSLAARLVDELQLPVYLYEWAARRREHSNLADVRKTHALALAVGALISPDLGPELPHRTAGAVAVGARPPLVALNCVLSTPDPGAAKRIAAHTRERGGGLRGVKALGLWLASGGKAQVSMNITDVEASPPHGVVSRVEQLAHGEGTDVDGSELVGLVPLDSVLQAAAAALRLPGLDRSQVLELALLERKDTLELDTFLSDLASSSPAPGGGAASALAGSLAAALTSMVCNLTIGRPRYQAVDERLREALARSEQLRLRLRQLMQADEDAYSALMAQYRLPKETHEQQEYRLGAIESALTRAADVPLETAEQCLEVVRLLGAVAREANRNAISDAAAAAILAAAAARASLLNVRVNASLMKDRELAAGYTRRMEALEAEVAVLSGEAVSAAVTRIG